VPPAPGVNSAVGLLATDLKHEIVRTFMTKARDADHEELSKVFGEMEEPIRDLLREEEVPDERVEIRREIDMCYFGQSFQLRVPMNVGIDAGTAEAMSTAFHDRHETVYGFCSRGEATMFVNLRLTAIGRVDRPRLRKLAKAKGSVDRAKKGRRKVYFADTGGMAACDIYDRGKLLFGDRIQGPAIIEQMDTTTVLPPDAALLVDLYGNLEITMGTGETP